MNSIKYLLAAAVIMVAGLIVAAPAQQASAAPGCFDGRLCLWDGADFFDSVQSHTLPAPYNCVTLSSGWKDSASSYYNNSYRTIDLYSGDGCTGLPYRLYPYTYGNISGFMNNNAQSFYVYP